MIFAVDFDGTLVKNKYPKIENPNIYLIDFCKNRQLKYNDTIILWTCRTGKYLEDAINYLKDNFDFNPDYILYVTDQTKKAELNKIIETLSEEELKVDVVEGDEKKYYIFLRKRHIQIEIANSKNETISQGEILDSEENVINKNSYDIKPIRPIGAVHGTYIIGENEDGMYIIDQHAAAERINYEKCYKALTNHSKNITLFWKWDYFQSIEQNQLIIVGKEKLLILMY